MDILMPKIGKDMTEGTITKWMKNLGDYVEDGDLIFELQNRHGTIEIEASVSGVLSEITVEAGGIAPVKTKIAVITEGEKPAGKSGSEAEAPAKKLIEEEKQRVSPLAKKVAEDNNIDLSKVPSHGRVLAQDILAYLKTEKAAPKQVQPEQKIPEPKENEELVTMNGMRKAIAKNMQASHMTSPTVTFNLGIDMSALKQYKEKLKNEGTKVSYTDFLVKLVSAALMAYPQLNCSVYDNKMLIKHYVNMGVAVALPNGLVVPNIRDAEKKSLTEISAEVKEIASKAKEGTLPMDRLAGGTFTITNLGMFGIESFSPIINQPEVAILGVNTIEEKVVVIGGQMVIRPIMNLSLTADHRVVDGSVAAEFLQHLKSLMENPEESLG